MREFKHFDWYDVTADGSFSPFKARTTQKQQHEIQSKAQNESFGLVLGNLTKGWKCSVQNWTSVMVFWAIIICECDSRACIFHCLKLVERKISSEIVKMQFDEWFSIKVAIQLKLMWICKCRQIGHKKYNG